MAEEKTTKIYPISTEDAGQSIKVKNATKQGYDTANPGDGINLSYPDSKTRRGRVGKECINTLRCNDQNGIYLGSDDDGVRIRRLTPKECWRLQGFPDEYFEKAKAAGVSNSQLYKQAGNAVTVGVARAIGEALKQAEEGSILPIEPKNGGNPVELKEITENTMQGYRVYDQKGLAATIASDGGGWARGTGLYLEEKKNDTDKP